MLVRDIIHIPINDFLTEEELNSMIDTINISPYFLDISKSNIIDLKNTEYPLSDSFATLVKQTMDIATIRAEKELDYILNLPDELITFKGLNLSQFEDSIRALCEIIHRSTSSDKLKVLHTIIPLFLRCDFENLNEKIVKVFINELRKNQKTQTYFMAFQIRCLIQQLQTNLNAHTFLSSIIIEICHILYKIYKTEECGCILPYLTNEFALIIKKINNFYFTDQSKNCDKLALQTYIPYSIMTLALIYPPSLEHIDWRYILMRFSVDNFTYINKYPSFEFCLLHPEKCLISHICMNAAVLIITFSFLSDLKDLEKQEDCLNFLHGFVTSSILARQAAAISLLNISKYKNFSKSYIEIQEMMEDAKISIGIFIDDIMELNYIEQINDLNKAYKLSKLNRKNFNEEELESRLKNLSYLSEPDLTCNESIANLARSVDCLLNLKIHEISSLIDDYPFFEKMQERIDKIIASGVCIRDFRQAYSFAHLCASYVSLLAKIQKNVLQNGSLLSVGFILKMFDHMISLFDPCSNVRNNKKGFDVYRSQMFLEMNRFCLQLATEKYLSTQFPIIFIHVSEEFKEYQYAAIVMLSTTISNLNASLTIQPHLNLTIHEFPPNILQPWQIAMDLICSDSPIVHRKSVECLTTFVFLQRPHNILEQVVNNFISRINANDKNLTKLLNGLLRFLIADVDIKDRLVVLDKTKDIVEAVLKHLKNSQFDINSLISVDILYYLCCYSFTTNKCVIPDKRMRSRTVTPKHVSEILTHFVSILNEDITSPELYLKIARSVLKLCDSRAFFTDLLKIPLNVTKSKIQAQRCKYEDEIITELYILKKHVEPINRQYSEKILPDVEPNSIKIQVSTPPRARDPLLQNMETYMSGSRKDLDIKRDNENMYLVPRASRFYDFVDKEDEIFFKGIYIKNSAN